MKKAELTKVSPFAAPESELAPAKMAQYGYTDQD